MLIGIDTSVVVGLLDSSAVARMEQRAIRDPAPSWIPLRYIQATDYAKNETSG